MLAESAKNLVPKFFDETGTTYDGVVSYGTLGKDKYWKRKILIMRTATEMKFPARRD